MHNDYKQQLAALYKELVTKQKNKKGVTSTFDKPKHANFRGKLGVSDVGIALTPRAIKKQRSNRAGYSYPRHLQRINEKRKADAQARHNISDEADPYNLKDKRPMQPAEKKTNYSNFNHEPYAPATKPKECHYYWSSSAPAPEPIDYIVPYETKPKESEYKSTGKFPKLDEAIAATKNNRKEEKC